MARAADGSDAGEPATAGAHGDVRTRCVRRALERGLSLATAESLTAGLVCAGLADVPGASGALRGGVVAYATELKRDLLDVPADLLAREGPVHPDVALAMAAGVRRRLGADVGVATTGVAGPGPSDGRSAGTAYAAVVGPGGGRVLPLHLPGDRAAVRAATAHAALALLAEVLEAPDDAPPGGSPPTDAPAPGTADPRSR
nr:CinA family protein [uncultured Pseudokineococcus sp.]